MLISELIRRFDGVKRNRTGYQARCPVHDDKTASLSITEKDEKILLHCHAGCATEAIMEKIKLPVKALFNGEPKKKQTAAKRSNSEEVACYAYNDENGDILYYIKKLWDAETAKKTFRGYQVNKDGKKVWSLEGVRKVIYNLPRVLESIALGHPIYIVEGEKDVETARGIGLTATTNPQGALKWRDEYSGHFEGADVVIIQDNDEAGKKHGEQVTASLIANGKPKSIKRIQFTELRPKADLTDWIELGHTVEELQKIVDAAPDELTKAAFAKLTVTVNDIREANDIRMIQDEIYCEVDGKIRLIHTRVLFNLDKSYKLKTTLADKERVYYQFKDGYWQCVPKTNIAYLFKHWLYESDQTSRTIKSILDLVELDPNFYVDYEQFNSRIDLVNLKNCAYDLVNFRRLDHSPDHFFTYKTDYDYDPDADCPVFTDSLEQYSIFDDDWINAFWEIAGYVMTGDLPYQKMFWFTGATGRNGKGTVIRVLQKLVGRQFTHPDIDPVKLDRQFFMYNLIGKRFATVGDLNYRLKNVAIIKQLTGGDVQYAEKKFGGSREFTPSAKIIYAMNQMPVVPDNEPIKPLRQRIVILPFKFQITNGDSTIEKKFEAELPGIFNKAVDGLKRLSANRRFTAVMRGEYELDIWTREANAIIAFLEDHLEYDVDDNGELCGGLFLKDIFKRYCEFMNTVYSSDAWRNERGVINNSYAFGKKLRGHFAELTSKRIYCEATGQSEAFYEGIRFKA